LISSFVILINTKHNFACFHISPIRLINNFIISCCRNKKIADKANREAESINIASAELKKMGDDISTISDKTSSLLNNIKGQLNHVKPLEGKDYSFMSNDEQLLCGALVNNTLSLAETLNAVVE
jgi:hypothetical protein